MLLTHSQRCRTTQSPNLTGTINTLSGTLEIDCAASSSSSTSGTSCSFKQQILQSLFGAQGLSLSGCTFGECVAQSVIDTASSSTTSAAGATAGKELSGGVIAGLAVVGALVAAALALLLFGKIAQRRARKAGPDVVPRGGVGVKWEGVGYVVPHENRGMPWRRRKDAKDAERGEKGEGGKAVLDTSGSEGVVRPGEMLAILGPSGERGV